MITDSPHIAIRLMGNEYYIQDTIFNSLVIILLVCLFALFVNYKVKQVEAEDTPSGLLNVMEILIESLNNMVSNTMGQKNMKYAPFILTLALYIGPSNLIGLVGFTPPTSNFNVTFALGIITFLMIQAKGIGANGIGGHIKGLFEPTPLLFPINLMGEIAVPVSLAFRLFGNVLAGMLILSLLYSALGFFAPLLTPFLHAYFDIFSGLLQTFIFAMLAMVQITMAE